MIEAAVLSQKADILRFEALGSTNDEALRQAHAGARGPLWIVAREQSGGRGRQGRSWTSPPGNLHASLLLADPCPPARAPELGFVCGVALTRALRACAGDDTRLALKWPNDVLFGDAKVAGLLLEATTLDDGTLAVVAGFGVNCASHPDGLAYPATSLDAALGRAIAPEKILDALAAQMQEALALWRARGFAAIRADWLALAAHVGRPLRVADGSRMTCGRFSGLDVSGRLILATDAGPVTLATGDIFPISHPAAHAAQKA